MKHSEETTTYAQMGMAALLPGMQYMLERMQHQLDEFRSQLAVLQTPVVSTNGNAPRITKNGKRIGRPRKEVAPVLRSGWPADPEERKAEMKRRMQVRKQRRANSPRADSSAPAPTHPRDANHPDHEAWVKKIRKANKRAWNGLNPEQRKARIAASLEGCRKKAESRIPTARLAVAS